MLSKLLEPLHLVLFDTQVDYWLRTKTKAAESASSSPALIMHLTHTKCFARVLLDAHWSWEVASVGPCGMSELRG